jgi:hypothetical protein
MPIPSTWLPVRYSRDRAVQELVEAEVADISPYSDPSQTLSAGALHFFAERRLGKRKCAGLVIREH